MALQKAIFVSLYFILYTGLNQVPCEKNVLLVLDKCQILSYTATKNSEHTMVFLFFSFYHGPEWLCNMVTKKCSVSLMIHNKITLLFGILPYLMICLHKMGTEKWALKV